MKPIFEVHVGAASRGDSSQDVRYVAKAHMQVPRDLFRFAPGQKSIAAGRGSYRGLR